MFRVLDTRTGELAISLDCCTPDQLDKAFRLPAKDGKLKCPVCRSTVALRRDFDAIPHFLHAKGSDCPHANEDLRLLELRAALYRQLRREFGHGVTVEHDLPSKAVPRSVDCWVDINGKKFAYWIFDKEVKSAAKRRELRSAIEAESVTCHFVFAEQMMKRAGENTLELGETEKFAKVCTPYDVLDGQNEGGSLHYLATKGTDAVLTTYRLLRDDSKSGVFVGIEKKNDLSDSEVCPHTGFLVHPGERSHAEIIRTRKAREEVAKELKPDDPEYIRRREWEAATRKLPRTNETVREIIARLLRPRSDIRTLELCREREAPCEFCGVVTRDWIVFTGQTGKCKCRTCYERMSAEKWRREHDPNWKPEDGKVA